MITRCSGYRDKENKIIPCDVVIKYHDSDTKALLEACKLAVAHVEGGIKDKMKRAIAKAEELSHGMCVSCLEQFKKVLEK